MRPSFVKALIIGWLGLMGLLSGCSAVRLSYDQGPQLAWWWLDGYVDFSSDESSKAKEAIRQWFVWHRASQLPEWATLLGNAQTEILEPTTAAAACRWADRIRAALQPSIDRAIDAGADLVPGLGEAQFVHLQQRYAKGNAEMRSDFLQPDRGDRLEASVKRAVERAESLYGTLDDAQRKLIAAGVAASPFDPEAWLADRMRRQDGIVQTLRSLVTERADRERIKTALRTLAERIERSPNPGYRAYQLRLADYNCKLAAQVHNATTAAQRRAARDKLKGWQDDLRSLTTAAAGMPGAPGMSP